MTKPAKALKPKYFSGFKVFLLLFFLMSLPCANASELPSLSASFIDVSSAPLIIYGQTFPKAVIYQRNTMYAPAGDFIYMLGVPSNLQGLPNQIIFNNQAAPISLAAIGPDRTSNQNIYYFNVTATLDYLGISYQFYNQGGLIQIKVEGSSSISTPPVYEASASISGQVVTDRIQSKSDVFLEKSFINNARIPETKIVSTTSLDSMGRFVFSGLEKGSYTVRVQAYYTSQSGLFYNNTTLQYYYYLTTYTSVWTQSLTLNQGQNASITLTRENTNSYQEIIYINTPGGPVPYTPPYPEPYYPGSDNSGIIYPETSYPQ